MSFVIVLPTMCLTFFFFCWIVQFIQNHGTNICKQNNHSEWMAVKFLILVLGLIQEIQMMQSRTSKCGVKIQTKSEIGLLEADEQLSDTEVSNVYTIFTDPLLFILVCLPS